MTEQEVVHREVAAVDHTDYIVSMDEVTFTYPGSEEPVLNGVTLQIKRGDFVAVIGGNGSGKSTLCKTLNGLIPHYYVGDFAGSVTVNGLNSLECDVARLSRHVGYVYQDFENQLIRPTVLDDASFAPLNYGFKDYLERGKRALQLTDLKVDHNEYIWQLSGGQKHQLALAGAVSLDPEILIIDEPVAQLDPCHAKDIYDLLKNLNERHGKTIIVIEHHTEFIAEYCKEVILMDKGRAIWSKPVKEALRELEQLKASQIYPPQVTQAASLIVETSNVGPNSYPVRLEEAVRYFEQLAETIGTTVAGTASAAIPADREAEGESKSLIPPVIEMEHIKFSYRTVTRQRKTVLQDVSVSFQRGDLVALVGNNGAGKSSLMRLITGVTKPEGGYVRVKGTNTANTSPEELANTVTYIYQNPEEMFIEDSIRKDIEFFLKARRVEGYQQKVDEIVETFGLTELQHRDGRLLSGGQQRRASLAIGVAMNPSIILLDEPTANLDIATRKDITRLLLGLNQHVETVIVATHDMQLVAEWANRVIVMNQGSIVRDGTRESVFEDSELLELAGLNAPQIMELSRKLNMSPLSYTVDDFAYRWNAVLPEDKKHRDQENGIESGQEVIENGICS
ncbi:energy-coupling factor transport system ATP-binding protein [Fontibacillus solani]|uniref:Energy-coupling factor transport system ATP-binding protein n=1 Tax=Fontibacillus solani TaxID=1572857 RepID=A0A7W3XSI1_9BACL|nr:energy-coupling factor transporter ATPase [Fontibacillus solani]MBA9086555.1 energy-coupling factor transport system ATP-binding protein [Fontibacillus solani]